MIAHEPPSHSDGSLRFALGASAMGFAARLRLAMAATAAVFSLDALRSRASRARSALFKNEQVDRGERPRTGLRKLGLLLSWPARPFGRTTAGACSRFAPARQEPGLPLPDAPLTLRFPLTVALTPWTNGLRPCSASSRASRSTQHRARLVKFHRDGLWPPYGLAPLGSQALTRRPYQHSTTFLRATRCAASPLPSALRAAHCVCQRGLATLRRSPPQKDTLPAFGCPLPTPGSALG